MNLYKNIKLDKFQEEAIHKIDGGYSLLVCAPTGSGKTLIAEYAIEQCLKEGKRAIYTAPVKALSNQKFRDFYTSYSDKVGIVTGDVSINPNAQIILMTTEIFRNTVFDSPESVSDVQYVILDEIHYLDDIERGTVWEECIIFAPQNIKFICLSATIPNVEELYLWISKVRPNQKLYVIVERERAVPLEQNIWIPGIGIKQVSDLSGRLVPKKETWLQDLVKHLKDKDKLPAIFFFFSRKDTEKAAASIDQELLTPSEKDKLVELFKALCKQFGITKDAYYEDLKEIVSRGVVMHHAGLLPHLKEVIERLFSTGLIKVLCATETFAVGVNMPARSVVFSSLFKFNGVTTQIMKVREHNQMSGRAGRRGIDKVGFAYTVIDEPLPAEPVKRTIYGISEPIKSQFNLSYSTILRLYERLGEKIFTACEKSLSNFARKKHDYMFKLDQLSKKLQVLRELNYINKSGLTQQGKLASRIYGYEIHFTELYFKGIFKGLNEDELNAVFCAICGESRRGVFSVKHRLHNINRVKKLSLRIIDDVIEIEKIHRVKETIKPMDYKFSYAMFLFSKGSPFSSLFRIINADDGDLIRTFRLTIQLVRNVCNSNIDDKLRNRLKNCEQKINRDVVDAQAQLLMSATEGVLNKEYSSSNE